MSNSSWGAAMAQLAPAQRDFMHGDASGLQQFYSHRDDVTVMGRFGGFERGWAEVGPRLAWAASHFHGGDYSQQDISVTVGRRRSLFGLPGTLGSLHPRRPAYTRH
jgi:hypothetical protein